MAADKMIKEVMGVLVPVATAVTASASVYYVFSLIDFPEAKLFAGIIFVTAFYKNWDTEP